MADRNTTLPADGFYWYERDIGVDPEIIEIFSGQVERIGSDEPWRLPSHPGDEGQYVLDGRILGPVQRPEYTADVDGQHSATVHIHAPKHMAVDVSYDGQEGLIQALLSPVAVDASASSTVTNLEVFAPPPDHWRNQLQALRSAYPALAAALESNFPRGIEHLPALGNAAGAILGVMREARTAN